MNRTLFALALFFGCLSTTLLAQTLTPYQVHSHNDYLQKVPFWTAYENGSTSIEVDVFLKKGQLYATHSESEIIDNRTLENLYLQPLQKSISLQLGVQQPIQLLIDIKSDAKATLAKLIQLIDTYPDLIANKQVSFVISGHRPAPKSYSDYPDHILFDYQSLEDLNTRALWDKVALLSLSFKNLSNWNGKGRLTEVDLAQVKETITKAKSYGKPFRFWGCPDSETAWKVFADLGVDFINTDKPFESSRYLNTLNDRIFQNLDESHIYQPTYASDQKNTPVNNVILLIGDGNGLTQISAATLANGGMLTLTQLKSIGFLKTQSADDFTTDSAAAGTALATGEKTYNRSIGMDINRMPIENLTELLYKTGIESGLISTDKITGATPAAFYSHQLDRDMTSATAMDLFTSKLSLFIAGGGLLFPQGFPENSFEIQQSISDIGGSDKTKVGYFLAENEVPPVLQGRGPVLAEATKAALTFFNAKKNPFFLMVEAAQIDSGGHENSTGKIISEGIDFDKAITEAIKFADTNPTTLVIITADHETSGFSIPQGTSATKTVEGDFTTYDHTGTMVPIFAYGPKSNYFSGVYENNAVFHKIKEVLQID